MRATDNAGLQTAELVLITVDRTAPDRLGDRPRRGRRTSAARTSRWRRPPPTPRPARVNTVTFQRSPAGAGTWTDVAVDSVGAVHRHASTRPRLADGLYDLRVFTTDAAGNAEPRPATIQVRVDNTIRPARVTAPADAADLRGTVALTSNSADAGSGVDTVAVPALAGRRGHLDEPGRELEHDRSDRRPVRPPRRDDRQRRQRLHLGGDHRPRRQHRSDRLGHRARPRGANVRGTIALTSNSADAGSGVATVQFQRSPAGAGTWTNQAASWNTTLQADGQYDLRVVTTDNAGNAFTSATVTVRVDNTLPTGSRHRARERRRDRRRRRSR